MSSLAAARADNYYYPKEWRPEHGSINKFHGSHPLGKRAKDIANGILVVRFEMPFNVWCSHCEQHIGRGVRFNARKSKVGMYFTTILYEFRMNCTSCQHELVIQTDPQNRGYKLIQGVKKQSTIQDEQDTQTLTQEMETEHLNDVSIHEKTISDPFFRLEHEQDDQQRAKARGRGLEALIQLQETQSKDDYDQNAALRARFRARKGILQQHAARADQLGLNIPLLDVHQEDVMKAKSQIFGGIPKKRKESKRKSRVETDSFQYFGDLHGSQLNRLKKVKYEKRKR